MEGCPSRFPAPSVALPDELALKARSIGPDVVLGLRPEALSLSPNGEIGASVIIVELLGAETHVICHTQDGTRLIVRQSAAATKPAIGEDVRIAVDGDAHSYHLFEATGDGPRLAGT